jgi:DNA-binding NarL/FixJ family response regulator
MSERPSVVLIEDEPISQASIRRLLERDGFEVVGSAGEAGVELALERKPDICLIDVSPNKAVRIARQIARRLPQTAVVMLSASSRHSDVIDAIRAGAVGYLLKGMDPDRLAPALHGVLAGEAAIPRGLVTDLVADLQTQGHRRAVVGAKGRTDLTSRQWEILDLICEGLSAAEIAERLSIKPVTVRRHTSEVLSKLGARSRTEAVALVRSEN